MLDPHAAAATATALTSALLIRFPHARAEAPRSPRRRVYPGRPGRKEIVARAEPYSVHLVQTRSHESIHMIELQRPRRLARRLPRRLPRLPSRSETFLRCALD